MGKDELVATLRAAGIEIRGEARLRDPDGWRFLVADGTILDCRDDGSWNACGHDRDALGAVLGPVMEVAPPAAFPVVIERAEAVAEPEADRIRVELNGRIGADAPAFTTQVFVSEALGRALALRLSTAAYRMRLVREGERRALSISGKRAKEQGALAEQLGRRTERLRW